MTNTLREARRLYDMGFAILWIKPRNKMPVNAGWTTGERQSWDSLKKSYQPGMNVGVRTGSPSQINGGYLACIDVDVKNALCRKEAISKLKELIGENVFPEVRSGSGNGSRHLYCVTEKPFKMVTVAKEEGWEICIYSDGRQMVLPPSIHPSGREYAWHCPLLFKESLPFMNFSHLEGKDKAPPKRRSFIRDGESDEESIDVSLDVQVDAGLDLETAGVEKDIRLLIQKGLWKGIKITDRSNFLPLAAKGLALAGLPKASILTALSDPTTFLGKCAYDHAQTKDRKRAMKWLYTYTVKEVLSELNSKPLFDEFPLPKLSKEEKEEANASKDPSKTGFYLRGKKGGMLPAYRALLNEFERVHPYRTIADMKTVFTFNGTHYVDSTPIEIKAFAEKKMSPEPEDKIRSEFQYKVLANNVTRRSFFNDSTEGKINFKNGVLNLNQGTDLLPHSPDFGFRGVLPYDFDPEAKCPVFMEWLSDIMLNDRELCRILQEYMGYIVRGGDYKYHKALWLGGVGRNGKSTFVDLLKALIGSGNFSVISIRALMQDKFAGAALDGKMANFSEETSPQELADSGPFKNLTGDGDLSAQKKYGDPYSFRNRAKLVMTYNTIPDLKDLSPGMLSRPLIIPFEKIIGEDEADRNIKDKLFAELPGIFNFALRGWHRLEKQEGFTKSERSEAALQKVKEESCNVFQWVENHVQFIQAEGGADRTSARDLYEAYKRSEKFPFREVEFNRRLSDHPKMKMRKKRFNNGTFYQFIQVV